MSDNEKQKAPPRVPKLNNLAGVVSELGRVYREARRGELPLEDATRLASILSILRTAIEGSDVERRLLALETNTNRGGR